MQLSNKDPELFSSVCSGDVTTIRTLLMKRIMCGHKIVFEKKLKEQSVWENPDDPENQAYIQEQVRLQNVQANLETAMEELPEGFGKVCMLYVNVEINGEFIFHYLYGIHALSKVNISLEKYPRRFSCESFCRLWGSIHYNVRIVCHKMWLDAFIGYKICWYSSIYCR